MPRLFETAADNNPNTANRVAFGRPGFAALYMTFVNFFIFLANNLRSASESEEGVIELATQAETDAGTDDERAVTPLKLAVNIAAGLKTKIIDIGDWDMDATVTVNIAHGLTLGNIRTVQVEIRNDSGGTDIQLSLTTADNSGVAEGNILKGGTNIVLTRRASPGVFDSTSYDSTSFNRGWVVIQYV